MSNEIETIQIAVDDIRQKIAKVFPEASCVNISELPDYLDQMKNTGVGSYSTVFLFSGKEDPEDPVRTTLNVNTGFLEGEDINNDWSQTSFTSSIYSLRSVSTNANWMTFALFNPSGEMVTEWSEPVNLRGLDGRDGKDGQDGQRGEKGDKGDSGNDGKDGSWFEFIYLALAEPRDIDAPYSNNVDGDCPVFDSSTNTYWTNNPTGVSPSKTVEYVCQREKDRTTNKWGPWSNPAVWAQWGKIGKDGNGVEYIFTLTNDINEQPTLPYSDPYKDESIVEGWSVTSQDGKYTWYDNPQTTSEKNKYCWVSIRRQYYKKDENGVDVQLWSEYSPAVIWSSFNKDGKNGGRTVMVYTSSEEFGIEIKAPINGGWDPNTNEIVIPTDPDDKFIWHDNTDDCEYKYLYVSSADFDGDGKMTRTWSKPTPMSGEDGQPGTDGDKIQFIYRVLPTKEKADLLIAFHKESGNTLESDPTKENVPSKIDISHNYINNWANDPEKGTYTISLTDWTDDATGIDGINNYVEVYCHRLYDGVSKTWGPWSNVMYWSIWGEDGTDGAGVEYIYKVTPDYVTKEGYESLGHELYVPSRAELQEKITDCGENYDKAFYQQYQFYFGDPWGEYGLDYDWYDEPQDVSKDEPVEWVRVRRYNPETKEWGDFGAPKIWNKFAHDGYAYLTSYVFTRSAEKPKRPIGGSYSTPIPDKVAGVKVWFDSIPGKDNGFAEDLPVYMSKRTFYSKNWDGDDLSLDENEELFDPDWDDPVLMQDKNDFQIEWSSSKECPAIGSFDPYYQKYISGEYSSIDQAELEWRKAYPGWSDTATNARWMATARLKNTVWTDWSVTEVKGEKGDAGENGTSVEIEGSAAYLDLSTSGTIPNEQIKVVKSDGIHTYLYLIVKELDNTHKLYKWNSDRDLYDDVELSEIQNGDGYITYNEDPNIDGYLWVWDGDSWEKVGQIQGPAGKTYKLYVRFSDDGGVSFTKADSETPLIDGTTVGKYIGYLVAEESMDDSFVNNVKNYKWALWTGDDGWGEEQVFILSKTNKAPEVPNDSTQIEDYCPEIPKNADGSYNTEYKGVADSEGKERWSDRPMSPTKEYPYVWNVERKATTSEFGEWKGDALNPGYAIFYNKYVWDPTYIELTNDLAVIPLEGDKIDPDFADTIDNTVLLYEGNKIVEDDDIQDGQGSDKAVDYYVIIKGQRYDSTTDGITIDDSVGLVSISPSLLQGVTEVTYGAIYNGNSYTKAMKVLFTQNAYEILLNKHVLVRTPYDADNENSGYLLDQYKTFTGTIRKWVDDKWIYPDEELVYFKYKHTDDIADKEETIHTEQGKFTIDLSDERCLSTVRVSVYNKENVEIYEEVGVVADGKDGLPGVDAITTKLINPSAQRIIVDGTLNNNIIETGIQIRDGIKFITDAEVSVTELNEYFSIDALDAETEKISDYSKFNINLSENIKPGEYNIEFQIVYKETLYKEIFSLSVVQNGENAKYYEIYPSSNIVKNPLSENPDPTEVHPIVYYIDGNTVIETVVPDDYHIEYTIDKTTNVYSNPIPASEITSQLVFKLYDNENALVDYCEVDPLSDGKDGTGITTQLANPNVRIQVNNAGKFNGFPQENYLQIFNGTKDITDECTYVVESNPFCNKIEVSEKEVNGVKVNIAVFTINEPTDDNFERIPSVHPITIYISNSTLGFTLSEILTISIESQGGESPIIVDLTNSMESVTATNGIVSEVSDITTSVYIHHGLQLIKEFELGTCTGYYVIGEEEKTIEGIHCEKDKNNNIIIKPNSPVGEIRPLLEWMDNSESKEFNFRLEFKFKDAEENEQTRHCILKLVKVSKAAKLVCFSSVFAEKSQPEIYLLAADGDRKGNLTSMLDLYANGEKVETYEDDNHYRWKYTITENDFRKEVINFELRMDDEVLDWEDIPLIHDGENGNNASFYKIGVNYGWVVKNSTGEVIVPSEDYIEPYIQLIDGYNKSIVDNWEQYNLSIKYSLDGNSEQDYTNPIDPNDITNQVVFYLYENGEYLNEHIETDVVYQEKGEKGDPASGFSWTLPPVSTVLAGNDSVKDEVLYNVLSVYKNEELLQIQSVEISELGFYKNSDWFNIYDSDDPYKWHFSYAINSDVIDIFERSWQVYFYVEVLDSEGNYYYLYIPQQISIVKSGGENAVHLELTNDSEMIFTDSNGVPRGDVYAETTAILYDGNSEVDPDDIDAVWTGCEGSNPDGHTFSVEFISEDVGYIDITANYKGIDYKKRFTVTKSYGQVPYKIIFDKNVINTDTDTTLGISILRGGQSFTSVLEGSDRYYLHINNADWWSGYPSSSISGDWISLSVSELDVSGPIKVELYEDDALLDSESVGIVKNGSDGSDYIIGDEDYKIIAEATAELVDGLYYSNEDGEKLAEAQTALNKAIYGDDSNPEEVVGLAAQVSALETEQESLQYLKDMFDEKDGKYSISSDVFNEKDLAALTVAMYGADGEEIMTKASIDTDSMNFSNASFAKVFFGGAGKFITISAEQIDGGTISGITVQNGATDSLKAGEGWKLNADGTGNIGPLNISSNSVYYTDGSNRIFMDSEGLSIVDDDDHYSSQLAFDGSGFLNGSFQWDSDGNVIKNNLYITEHYSNADYVTPELLPNGTTFCIIRSADVVETYPEFALNLPRGTTSLYNVMGDGQYYGSVKILNQTRTRLIVNVYTDVTSQETVQVTIKKYGALVIDYFIDLEDGDNLIGYVNGDVYNIA